MNALLVDIGNSRVKWRTASGGPAGAPDPSWTSIEQAMPLSGIDGLKEALASGLATASDGATDDVELVMIANVASEASATTVERAVSTIWPRAAVRQVHASAAACGVVNGYRDPRQLGADRWLAAIAAHALHSDRSVLVCSFGTATTIDLVEVGPSADGARFIGGLILPGIETMLNALSQSTARLPKRAGQVVDFGDCTEDAISSGVMAAQVGAMERAIRHMRARQPSGSIHPAMCLVSGGAAGTMAASFDELDMPHRVIHDLVLRGLAITAEGLAFAEAPPPATLHR